MTDAKVATTNSIRTLLILVLGIILIWILVPIGFFYAFINYEEISRLPAAEQIATYGIIGDSFGTVNALFAGLAFAGLIWTIRQQHKELQIQKQMLAAQINEQRESRLAMQDQANAQEDMIKAIEKLAQRTETSTIVSAAVAALQQSNFALTVGSKFYSDEKRTKHQERVSGIDDLLIRIVYESE